MSASRSSRRKAAAAAAAVGRAARQRHLPFRGWQFAGMPAEPAALTLAVGVAVRRVLERVAGLTILLKWPNDLVFDDRKLGGILLELKAEAHGGAHVVVGRRAQRGASRRAPAHAQRLAARRDRSQDGARV
jgi:hypothetical protein